MTYVVLGGGLVGTEVARILQQRRADFAVVTRTRKEVLPGVFSVAADASSSEDLIRAIPSPSAVINALNAPNYTRWAEEFPPLNRAVLEFSIRNSAPLVSVSNLYMYDSTLGPIGPETPISESIKKGRIRQEMWLETKEYMSRGLAAAEVRASDYISHGEQSPLGDRFAATLLVGKAPSVIGNPAAKHSWTSPLDVARTCLAVLDQKAFGKVWHVPTNAPKTFQEVADDICEILGIRPLAVKSIPKSMFHAIGYFSPIVKELRETAYQFERDFIIDDNQSRSVLGIEPTEWELLVRNLVQHYKSLT